MALKIEMLRAFATVAETGNLSDAAARLGRTQSAISMVLKQFEGQLGRPLFESDRKNRLTPLGQQILQLAQSQIRSFDTSIGAIELLARSPDGVLKVAAVPSLAALVFPDLVRALERQFPGAKLELRDTDTPQVMEAMTSGWADIGIASASAAINGVSASELFRDPFGVVMSQSHPLAAAIGPVTIADLFAAGFIRNELCDHIVMPAFQDALKEVHLTVRNLQSLLAMLHQGDWVSALPPSVVDLAGPGLVFRPIEGLTEQRKVYVLRRESSAFPDIVDAAEREIKARFAKGF